jgi:serine/threonine-protein kinase
MDKAVHPNVVRIHGHGRWPDPVEGHTYHVMDLVPGLSLDEYAETLNPSFLRFAEAGAKLALALGELHARGVVHRDVKPENILIREPDGEPVLVDFGIGVYEGASPLTPTSLPPGTAHLRSPEAMRFWMQRGQHASEPYQVGAADDLYALGVSLYRAVTGHYPFNPELPGDFLAVMIAHHRAHAPRDFNRRVPGALSDVLMRMMAKDPKQRYRDGAAVHEALMAAAAFGKRGEWEASLFEWEPIPAGRDGEAPGRRIRRPAFPTRPLTATSPRFMLLASNPSAGRRGRGQRAGAPTPEGRGRGRALQVGGLAMVLGLGLTLTGLWALPRRASEVLPRESGEVARALEPADAGSAAAPLPPESTPAAASPGKARATKGAPLKKLPPTTPREPSRQLSGAPGKVLGTTALCVGLACAGAQRRPTESDCPAEARAAMKALGQRWGYGPTVLVDLRQGEQYPPLVRSGPIVSRVKSGREGLTEGSLLFGELFTEGTNVYGRYDRAQTPDGKTYPVCFILGTSEEDGLEKIPSSEPGAVYIANWSPIAAVKRFVFREPGTKPKPED